MILFIVLLFIFLTWITIKINERRENARSASMNYHKVKSFPESFRPSPRVPKSSAAPTFEELKQRSMKPKKKSLGEVSQDLRKVFEEIKRELNKS